MKKVGQIEVRVYQMKDSGTVRLKKKQGKAAMTKVPENIMKGKAISHSIQ